MSISHDLIPGEGIDLQQVEIGMQPDDFLVQLFLLFFDRAEKTPERVAADFAV
jgi:hypothetical protein